MSIADYPNPKPFVYSRTTVERAERSLICSPFKLALFVVMQTQSVPVSAIAMENGVKQGYTQRPLSELACDNDLNWLIQVGVLRREVDGQGITDSFRLTPLGYQLLEKLQRQELPTPTLNDRFYDALIRWFRLPF
ncbi:hypothetical protein A0J48_022500 [Sphaerospermopsis aphanizomenoides BCCUSP55]|uniref:Npun_F0494 family protein n=1 Tax=Sphaerospermopsis aphanizomenoides TaxID=459663 RepID=UPI001902D23A|nr:Npun_F0494 family protein [Sphaerospermopsis aphanizomenoides]MBK1990261.1 hypothetical protein [Sphaerospermopsis aphanizomenoides BCCUSP55]